MSLAETINADFTAAMKGRREAELSTLRMLRSALKNRQIELMHELEEEEALAVVKSQIKQIRDGMESYASGGREDLIEQARVELTVLEKYLPPQMDDTVLEATVKGALEAAGLTSKQDMGKAMGVAMKAVNGAADGGRVKAAVDKLLS